MTLQTKLSCGGHQWGWDDIERHLLVKIDDLDDLNVRHYLWWSVRNGNDWMLSLLLERYRVQVDEHGHDNYLGSLLSQAKNQDHDALVRLLLSRNDMNPIPNSH